LKKKDNNLSSQGARTEVQNVEESCAQTSYQPLVRARRLYWAIVIVLGFLQAYSYRLNVSHDGVSYLDIADNYARGAWGAAINGYWSPLYSWLLALGDYTLRFPRGWESTYLHLINFVGYLCAYRCFEFFLQELIQTLDARVLEKNHSTILSDRSWRLLGLGLFLYSSLRMANHAGSSPDIFVVLFVYLAMGLLLRIHSGQAGSWTYASFGAALAFGYFAKTAMFPLAFVFLGVAAVAAFRIPRTRLLFLLAPIVFMFIAAPWIIALSRTKGRPTFGDTGRLAYAGLVGPKEAPLAWGGQANGGEHLAHPPRRLGNAPPVIEFASPVPGTFPLWYDGSYWLEGTKVHFSISGELRVLRQSVGKYAEILNSQREYLILLLILLFMPGSITGYFDRLLKLWPIWLPSLMALVMYALVYLESRYVAPFVVILWIALFAATRLRKYDGGELQRFGRYAVTVTVLVASLVLLRGAASDVYSILRPRSSEQFEVAKALQNMAIAPGQRVSLIGTSRDSFYWARLADLRIISIVPNEDVGQYWFGSLDTQRRVHSQFAETGAIAIITDAIPCAASRLGWEQIGQTSYFTYRPLTVTVANTALPRVGINANPEAQSDSKPEMKNDPD
jgi:hypothetical protein